LISVSTLVALVVAVFATSIPNAQIRPSGFAFVLGIGMMLAGVGVRTLAARSLGRYYTLNVGIQPGQAIHDAGLYHWVRHPGYLGTLTALLGVGVVLGNWFSVVAILLILPALGARIALEERLMKRAFGDAYDAYCTRTRWRLLPGVL
jgi:protein-S-isoprenylcysteine O-methyltransferase